MVPCSHMDTEEMQRGAALLSWTISWPAVGRYLGNKVGKDLSQDSRTHFWRPAFSLPLWPQVWTDRTIKTALEPAQWHWEGPNPATHRKAPAETPKDTQHDFLNTTEFITTLTIVLWHLNTQFKKIYIPTPSTSMVQLEPVNSACSRKQIFCSKTTLLWYQLFIFAWQTVAGSLPNALVLEHLVQTVCLPAQDCAESVTGR